MFIFVPKSYAAEYPNIIMGQNMTVGSTGQGVVVLQGLMSELGFLNVPDGIPFGYYGGMTRDAVAKYQSSTYVTPAVGYYGPVTKSSMYNDFSNHGWLGMLGWQ
jgi:peptidoglycan hydrolase-like protein with peptidoglycan-binding domain